MSTQIMAVHHGRDQGYLTRLAPGTYDVRIRDAGNPLCIIILNATLQITQPVALSATVVKTDISCFGANDGVIQITSSAGGYGTYQYSIDAGATLAEYRNILRIITRYIRCAHKG